MMLTIFFPYVYFVDIPSHHSKTTLGCSHRKLAVQAVSPLRFHAASQWCEQIREGSKQYGW
jgi:hypothetical protein